MAVPADKNADFDVLIVGGGIAGASLGAELARSLRVGLIEAETHCGMHATGRSAAFWLESYGGPVVAQLTSASRRFLERPPKDFSDAGFLSTRGAVHVSETGWAELSESVQVKRLDRAELERLVPGIRPKWRFGVFEPGCADIDVAALHSAYLRQYRRRGGEVRTDARLVSAERSDGRWTVRLQDGATIDTPIVVNASGAWADEVARMCAARPLGIAPKRRTMVQLRVARSGLRALPLVTDSGGRFYFKGEGDRTVWLSPHDEIDTDPCDAAPEEIDVAVAIDRFERVVDWPVEAVERSWAGLRSFAPDRVPVYGFEPSAPGFFWCAGQGGFGIQTAPAAAKLAAALLLRAEPDPMVAHIDPLPFSPSRF
jgi:D-arginine dehydrogenase